jgi:hypothetical protein
VNINRTAFSFLNIILKISKHIHYLHLKPSEDVNILTDTSNKKIVENKIFMSQLKTIKSSVVLTSFQQVGLLLSHSRSETEVCLFVVRGQLLLCLDHMGPRERKLKSVLAG